MTEAKFAYYSHTSIIRASIIRGPLLYAVFKQEFGIPKYLNYTSNYLYFTRTSIIRGF